MGWGEECVAGEGVGDGDEEGVVAVVLEEGEEALGGELGADVVGEVCGWGIGGAAEGEEGGGEGCDGVGVGGSGAADAGGGHGGS